MAPEMNEGAVFKPKSSETLDKRESVQNDDEVRKNFPETWVWLNAVARYDHQHNKLAAKLNSKNWGFKLS